MLSQILLVDGGFSTGATKAMIAKNSRTSCGTRLVGGHIILKTVGQVPNDIQGKSDTKSKYRISILVGILIACALSVRMYRGDAPFMTFGYRSYDSAVYAQATYLLGDPSTPECIRRVAQTNLEQAFVMEPRVVERLAVLGYRVFGICNWWPRLMLSLIWCLSALALFALVARMHSLSSALVSMIFYLFSPCAIMSSRYFHPDPGTSV